MKLELNKNLLTNAPLSGSENKTVDEADNKLLNIQNDILKGEPGCYLVSGYRGVGKTTYINKLMFNIDSMKKDKDSQKEKIFFVKLSMPKYESHSIVLRKLIRQLYIAFNEEYKNEKSGWKFRGYIKQREDKLKKMKLERSLKKLFLRTFNEVTETNTIKHSQISSSNLSYNGGVIKKIYKPTIVFILSLLDIHYNFLIGAYNFLTNTNFTFSYFILAFSAIWGALSYKKEIEDQKLISNESIVSSLYDDEIAELRLKESLEKLKSEGFKPVFVIDEVDKINNVEDVESLIGELKTIILADLSSFIFITGQSMYYQFNNANLEEDSLIASVFSKTIHVPLLNIEDFKKMVYEFLNTNNQSEAIKYYIESKIFSTNRVTRRFLNSIKKDIHWEGDKAYLHIKDSIYTYNKNTSKLLNNIEDVISENQVLNKYDKGISDFLVTQLHKWSQKMLSKKKIPFLISDIFDNNKEYDNPYHLIYLKDLDSLLKSLIKNLKNKKLLNERVEEDNKFNKIITYSWVEDISNIEYIDDFTLKLDPATYFLNQYITFESLVRNIYGEIMGNYDLLFSKMINELLKREVIELDLNKRGMIESMRKIRNDYVHFNKVPEDISILTNYAFDLLALKEKFIYSYYKSIISAAMPNHSFEEKIEDSSIIKLSAYLKEFTSMLFNFEVFGVGLTRKQLPEKFNNIRVQSDKVNNNNDEKQIFFNIIYIDLDVNETNYLVEEFQSNTNEFFNVEIINKPNTVFPRMELEKLISRIRFIH